MLSPGSTRTKRVPSSLKTVITRGPGQSSATRACATRRTRAAVIFAAVVMIVFLYVSILLLSTEAFNKSLRLVQAVGVKPPRYIDSGDGLSPFGQLPLRRVSWSLRLIPWR